MDKFLWILQAILAIKFLSATFTHAVRPDAAKFERGRQRLGARMGPILALVSLGTLLGAVGVALPALLRSLGWLVPWAAGLLAVLMLAAAVVHLACREAPKTWVSLILFALAATVAYGRFVLFPL